MLMLTMIGLKATIFILNSNRTYLFRLFLQGMLSNFFQQTHVMAINQYGLKNGLRYVLFQLATYPYHNVFVHRYKHSRYFSLSNAYSVSLFRNLPSKRESIVFVLKPSSYQIVGMNNEAIFASNFDEAIPKCCVKKQPVHLILFLLMHFLTP